MFLINHQLVSLKYFLIELLKTCEKKKNFLFTSTTSPKPIDTIWAFILL